MALQIPVVDQRLITFRHRFKPNTTSLLKKVLKSGFSKMGSKANLPIIGHRVTAIIELIDHLNAIDGHPNNFTKSAEVLGDWLLNRGYTRPSPARTLAMDEIGSVQNEIKDYINSLITKLWSYQHIPSARQLKDRLNCFINARHDSNDSSGSDENNCPKEVPLVEKRLTFNSPVSSGQVSPDITNALHDASGELGGQSQLMVPPNSPVTDDAKPNILPALSHQVEALAPGYQVKRKVEITSLSTLLLPSAFTTAPTGGQHAVNANKSSRDTTSSVLGGGDHQSMDTSKPCPIAAITSTDWLIRVRVLSKTAIQTVEGREGKPDGRFFSFDAADDSSDIRITAFNAECDKYYDFIEKDLNYYIHKGSVKTVYRQISKKSDLKRIPTINLTHDSVVTQCLDDIPVPPKTYRFVPIANLTDQPVGDTIDVVGVIHQVDDLQTIVAKKSRKELRKRDVSLVDKSLAEVRLTLWGREAEEFTGTVGQVMAIKNAVVGEFQGRTLSCATNATIDYDPDIEDAHVLKGWYDRLIEFIKMATN